VALSHLLDTKVQADHLVELVFLEEKNSHIL